jgi:quinol---cytochrome-c reductase cytochrome b subunit
MGFLDGALRIMPGSELNVAGHPLTLAVLVPALIVPGAFFTLLAAYPLLERRLTGDRGMHHWFFRVAVLAGPPLAYILTQRICLSLTRRDQEETKHGRETGRIMMSPSGGFSETLSKPAHT